MIRTRVFLAISALVAAGLANLSGAGAAAADPTWAGCLHGPADRQAVFARAAALSGVPESVLLGVSYLESRWDDHAGAPSSTAGYGPMHLTAVPKTPAAQIPIEHTQGKGEDDAAPFAEPVVTATPIDAAGLQTASAAAELTGYSVRQVTTDDVANICAGAALLASYAAPDAAPTVRGWTGAIEAYAGSAEPADARHFANQVLAVIRTGASRVTNDGQLVTLVGQPTATLAPTATASTDRAAQCPNGLGCEWLPAPYESTGDDPTAYGHYDLADRPRDMKIDYIIIHDTEGYWDGVLDLAMNVNYAASWHYTLRSADGHIAQHVDTKDVGWHAGNWYVNMHSIGLEHEGFAAQGAAWYSERLYQTSAELVRYLAAANRIPLDRAHIIGHDEIPGTVAANVAGMHWDPGPYWDWTHYMALLGNPIKPTRRGKSNVVTVRPDFAANRQQVTSCDTAGVPCTPQGTNFVYLRQAPRADAPLVNDIALQPDGSPATTNVSDIGARAGTGHRFLVAKRSGDWLGVWWLGNIAWLHNPKSAPVVVPAEGRVVRAAGNTPVPVYGRAYPEQAAYPAEIPYQTVSPLQYTIKPGQAYVLARDNLQTDYYYAKTFNCAGYAADCTQVLGQDRYYQIWLGHRMAYVRAADVTVRTG